MFNAQNSTPNGCFGDGPALYANAKVWWFLEKEKSVVDKETKECPEWVAFRAKDSFALEKEYSSWIKHKKAGHESVVVGPDKLYNVDLKCMKMIPIYWDVKLQSILHVRRSNWFWRASTGEFQHPVSSELSLALEDLFQKNKEFIYASLDDAEAIDKFAFKISSDYNALGTPNVATPHETEKTEQKKFNPKTHVFTRTIRFDIPLSCNQQTFTSCVFICNETDGCWLRTESVSPVPSVCPRSSLKKLLSTGKVYRNAFNLSVTDKTSNEEPLATKTTEQISSKSASETNEDNFEQTNVQDLIFIVHGVAQKFIEKSKYPSIIEEADSMREIMKDIVKKRNGKYDFQLIPIRWRHSFNFFGEDVAASEHFDRLQEKIMLPSLPSVRSLMSEFAIDILLYMTDEHYERILTFMIDEMNRAHDIFIEKNPNFTGKIHILGHSLGSVLAFNLLTSAYDGKSCSSRLNFKVDRFFALGSPIGLFILLKKMRLNGTRRGASTSHRSYAKSSGKHRSSPCSTDPFLVNDCFLDCNEFYNVFHPHDPVAYRIEPLIDSGLSEHRPLTVRSALMFGGPFGGDDPMKKSYFNTAAFGISKKSKKNRKSAGVSSPYSDSEFSFENDTATEAKKKTSDPIKMISNSFRNLFWGSSAHSENISTSENQASPSKTDEHILVAQAIAVTAESSCLASTATAKIYDENQSCPSSPFTTDGEDSIVTHEVTNIAHLTVDTKQILASEDSLETSISHSFASSEIQFPAATAPVPGNEASDVIISKKLETSPNEPNLKAFLKPFNNYRRVDFSLSEGILEYSYFSMFSAHTSYWKDRETMKFILNILKASKQKS